jgi:Ca2+-binding RTX toxin-like protein
MRRTLLVLATTMSFAVLVIGGVAYALTIQCDGEGDQDPATGGCAGTENPDTITGTKNPDFIFALGGDDTVDARGGRDREIRAGGDFVAGGAGDDTLHGRSGPDGLFGEAGNDSLFGESGLDTMEGEDGSNEYFGASGADSILADQSRPGETERVSAGPGNDFINSRDAFFFGAEQDNVDCGSGKDRVVADPIDDIAANCETVAPN